MVGTFDISGTEGSDTEVVLKVTYAAGFDAHNVIVTNKKWTKDVTYNTPMGVYFDARPKNGGSCVSYVGGNLVNP